MKTKIFFSILVAIAITMLGVMLCQSEQLCKLPMAVVLLFQTSFLATFVTIGTVETWKELRENFDIWLFGVCTFWGLTAMLFVMMLDLN